MTPQKSPVTWLLTAALALCAADAAHGAGPPAWLPRYDVNLDLDVAGNIAKVHFHAVWTNRTNRPARELVFNAHSRYIVPDADVGLMAKTLEILRMNPGEVLGVKEPAFELHRPRRAALRSTCRSTTKATPAPLSSFLCRDPSPLVSRSASTSISRCTCRRSRAVGAAGRASPP
jgi:hypothetical protein